ESLEENQFVVEGPKEEQDYNPNSSNQEKANVENPEVFDSINDTTSEDSPEITKEVILPSYIDESESEILVDYDDNESASANEFRRLSRKIVNTNGTYPAIRSILVTSAMKNEGKSLIAANLAITMAKRETKNILLIDCDLRRPMINSLFGIKREPGLTSLLLGEAEINNVIRNTKLSNLKVLPSGHIIDSPSFLIPKIKDIIDICKNQFDVIICDSPPVMPVDDSVVLSQYIDGVLFVVMAGKTDRVVIKRAVDMLSDAKASLLGIVMNNMYKVMPYYYDYNYLKNKN
ncbi:CpsD/CapB family tyrosine-protein kinase, partial [Candidatus Poribacteria bacterium]|nr:CpsD/CapB family tyrosine-protein kinase [Candidatus Poribacteria bacterium]